MRHGRNTPQVAPNITQHGKPRLVPTPTINVTVTSNSSLTQPQTHPKFAAPLIVCSLSSPASESAPAKNIITYHSQAPKMRQMAPRPISRTLSAPPRASFLQTRTTEAPYLPTPTTPCTIPISLTADNPSRTNSPLSPGGCGLRAVSPLTHHGSPTPRKRTIPASNTSSAAKSPMKTLNPSSMSVLPGRILPKRLRGPRRTRIKILIRSGRCWGARMGMG